MGLLEYVPYDILRLVWIMRLYRDNNMLTTIYCPRDILAPNMVHLMQSLCKDVAISVYRELHRTSMALLNEEYQRRFVYLYENSYNYRKLKRHQGNYYISIFSIFSTDSHNKRGELPRRYIFSYLPHGVLI